MGLFTRAFNPPPVEPNANDPALNPPGTVGPGSTAVVPGDPDGFVITPSSYTSTSLPTIVPSPWSGWPASWYPPQWSSGGPTNVPTDTAFMCLDLNASALSTMPPYLVNAAPSLDAEWLRNPNPNVYTSWEEFAKRLFWDYQAVGEVFIHIDTYYATGWPARFHILPPWSVNVEMRNGMRVYTVGSLDVTADMLHIRYLSSVDDAHGHGPLEAGRQRLVAAEVLSQYAAGLVSGGGIPTSVLEHPEELTADQTANLKAQWVAARLSSIGEPAVLSGGVTWKPVQLDATQIGLVPLSQQFDSRIAALLGVPPYMVALQQGDSMTYANASTLFDFHWRSSLRPKAQAVMSALSQRLLPRETRVELNRDEYIRPGPLERAQTDQILAGILDPATGQPAKTVQEIREAERLSNPSPELASGVLR